MKRVMKKTLPVLLGLLLFSGNNYAEQAVNEHSSKAAIPAKAAITMKADTSGKTKNITPSKDSSYRRPPLTLIPPAKQNLIDLQTLLEFLMQEENQTIAATIESIDLVNKAIEFNHGCKVFFTREDNEHTKCGHMHMPGPAAPLKISYIVCN